MPCLITSGRVASSGKEGGKSSAEARKDWLVLFRPLPRGVEWESISVLIVVAPDCGKEGMLGRMKEGNGT